MKVALLELPRSFGFATMAAFDRVGDLIQRVTDDPATRIDARRLQRWDQEIDRLFAHAELTCRLGLSSRPGGIVAIWKAAIYCTLVVRDAVLVSLR